MSWRERAKPIIARVLKEHIGASDKEIRSALYEAYPFGMRQYTPYKVWLDEIARQRGIKPTPTRGGNRAKRYHLVSDPDPRQEMLFL